MCEHCADKDQEQVREISAEELQELLEATQQPGEEVETVTIFFDPLCLDTENLAEDVEFDKAEFKRGIKEGSFVAGFYTALLNSGMSLEDAFSCIVNDYTYKMNVKLAEINSKATIEAAKNAQVAVEKQQL